MIKRELNKHIAKIIVSMLVVATLFGTKTYAAETELSSSAYSIDDAWDAGSTSEGEILQNEDEAECPEIDVEMAGEFVDDEAAVCDFYEDGELPAEEDVYRVEASGTTAAATITGNFYVKDAATVLARLNAIRREACNNGYKNPDTGARLTSADYVPLRWSKDLEIIARQRAAEADIYVGHMRPNGTSCFTVQTETGEQSWAENLAWNNSEDCISRGVEQWYEEKSDYINNGAGQTGHYKSIINPKYKYVGLGGFRYGDAGWYSVAQEFSYKDTLDSTQLYRASGAQKVRIEVGSSYAVVNKTTITEPKYAVVGDKGTATGTIDFTSPKAATTFGSSDSFSGKLSGAPYISSDESVLKISSSGAYEALKKGDVMLSTGIPATNPGTKKIHVFGVDEPLLTIVKPTKTVYLTGEKLNLAGGKYTNYKTGKTAGLTANMVTGFDSSQPGIKTLTVTSGDCVNTFKVLVIDKPETYIPAGSRLSGTVDSAHKVMIKDIYGTINADANGYFTFASGVDTTVTLSEVGIYTYKCTYNPVNTTEFSARSGININVKAYRDFNKDAAQISLLEDEIVYNGYEKCPDIRIAYGLTELVENVDYTLIYRDNIHAGTGVISVSGNGLYRGNYEIPFGIERAKLTVCAKNAHHKLGSLPSGYSYTVKGMSPKDEWIKKPVIKCAVSDNKIPGKYEISVSDGIAIADYDPDITYIPGVLTLSGDRMTFTVKYDLGGHGQAIADSIVDSGRKLIKPDAPAEEGYIFAGWYTAADYKKQWDFDKSSVSKDMTLYARWLKKSGKDGISVSDISPTNYTGKAIKPLIKVYDGEKLLKAGTDYKLSYYNNVSAATIGSRFDETKPYVHIIGKGSYNFDIKEGFSILPTSIGNNSVGQGIVVKGNQQLIYNTKKSQKVISSIKYKKALTADRDYEIKLIAGNFAFNDKGKQIVSGNAISVDGVKKGYIPAGFSGRFELSIKGINNYCGEIRYPVYVTNKQYLMKNAKITIGRGLKKSFKGSQNVGEVKLTPGYYDVKTRKYYRVEGGIVTNEEVKASDVYLVKCGKDYLICGRNFEEIYANNTQVGKATLTIRGIGRYMGDKAVNVNIAGEGFKSSAIKVTGLPANLTYSGEANTLIHDVTDKDGTVALIYHYGKTDARILEYGPEGDYTVTYSANINKGKMVITYTGNPERGWKGSFKKTVMIK